MNVENGSDPIRPMFCLLSGNHMKKKILFVKSLDFVLIYNKKKYDKESFIAEGNETPIRS